MTVNLSKVKARQKELETRRYIDQLSIGPIKARRIDQPEAPAQALKAGDRWGERDTLYEMSLTVQIPAEWREGVVALRLDLSQTVRVFNINTVEGLLFVNGHPFHALDRYHREIILTPEQVARRELDITVRLWTGIAEDFHTVERLELRRLDPTADRLYSMMGLLLDALEHLPTVSPSYISLSAALDEACNTLDFRNVSDGDFFISCRKAEDKLTSQLQALNPSDQKALLAGQPQATAIGHAHIDVAWLWRLSHTRLKAANTFSTALYHMDRYPHFTYIQSQPQLYQFVKEDQPELYERIKQKVASGQWEPEGAMWVEADTNITGGESLVRQFLFGQRFFQAEFGYRSRVLWLPDVFGYSPALPQLIKGAGADYFITSKLSWNDTNRMPADTFWWKGLDGSRVLTYFLTAQNDDTWHAFTYNGEMKPGVLARGWKNYLQKDINREILVAYGYGDGGGGPTRQMIEAAEMIGQPLGAEVPVARTGRVADFMARVEENISKAAQPAPDWVGELYFEYHRGTYTSQGRVKRGNRQAEQNLHNTELLNVLAQSLTGATYPKEELDAIWRVVLTHQFHDILPGSSIGEVYSDAATNYAQVEEVTSRLTQEATEQLSAGLGLAEGEVAVFNSLSWNRGGLVELAQAQAQRLGLPSQTLEDGRTLVEVAEVPSLGCQVYQLASPAKASATDLIVSKELLENSFWRIELNKQGQLTRLFDRVNGREVLAPGARANVFQMFEDKPLQFDAWDIDAFYEQKGWELDKLTSIEVIEQGPLRAGLRLEWNYAGRTKIVQKLYIYAHQPRIDFVTEVDWQERQTLLKVAFPVDIHADYSTAEMQWGNVRRPTHRNTSWDQARFETCAHKWFDLSEGDYGVAILNDCKYGYDVHHNVMRQTLLKAAISPDPNADLGHHQFTYSLLPHSGNWYEAGVYRAAYELNYPLLVNTGAASRPAKSPALPKSFSLVEVSVPNVIVETVKQAEDSSELIVRLYECANRRGSFELRLPNKISSAVEVNLLEEPLEASQQQVELTEDGRVLRSQIRPYEIKTFRIALS